MSIGDVTSLDSARVMAGAGYGLMTDAALLAAAKADRAARMAGMTYVSHLPADRTEPPDLPDWLRKTGADDLVSFDPA